MYHSAHIFSHSTTGRCISITDIKIFVPGLLDSNDVQQFISGHAGIVLLVVVLAHVTLRGIVLQ